MAVCETEHWILDCGAGHSCFLSEYSGSGALHMWGCGGAGSSSANWARPKPKTPESEPSYVDGSTVLEFCCSDMTRGELAEVFDEMVTDQLVVPKGTYRERVTHCATATLDEHVRAVGLVVT